MNKEDEGRRGLFGSRKIFKRSNDECSQHLNVLKSTGTIAFFSAIVVLIVCIIFYIVVSEMENINSRVDAEKTKHEFDTIVLTKAYLEAESTNSLMEITTKLRQEIIDTFDMDELESQLNKRIIPSDLSKIFSKYLKNKTTVPGLDPQTNNIVVCMGEGVIEDFSTVYASYTDDTRTWEFEKTHELNPELFHNSIQAILDQNTRVYYVEQYKHLDADENTDKVLYPYINQEVLEEIYDEYGINGLKDYTFLVPVYIDEDGDIFGNMDIVNGHRVKNNKFIIIQRYSLYDYLKLHNIDTKFDNGVEDSLSKVQFFIQLSAILIILLSILVVVFMANIVNDVADGDAIRKAIEKEAKELQE